MLPAQFFFWVSHNTVCLSAVFKPQRRLRVQPILLRVLSSLNPHVLPPSISILLQIRFKDRCEQAEPLPEFAGRTRKALQQICDTAHSSGGRTVAVVAHSAVLSALICHCLGLDEVEESLSLFRTDGGSVTVVSSLTLF